MFQTLARLEAVEDFVQIMRVLADPTRLRLLSALQAGERNVTSLCEELDLAQPTVSHHLGLLRSAQLVSNRRSGKNVFYTLSCSVVADVNTPELRIRSNGAVLHFRVQNLQDQQSAAAAGPVTTDGEAKSADGAFDHRLDGHRSLDVTEVKPKAQPQAQRAISYAH